MAAIYHVSNRGRHLDHYAVARCRERCEREAQDARIDARANREAPEWISDLDWSFELPPYTRWEKAFIYGALALLVIATVWR